MEVRCVCLVSLLYFGLSYLGVGYVHAENHTKSSQIADPDVRYSDIVIVVLSQPNTYHSRRADKFVSHVKSQLKDIKKADQPEIYQTHRKWPQYLGSFSVFPLLSRWADEFKNKAWIFFCEEETRINLKRLLRVLQRYNHKQDWFLGKGLYDVKSTIIHHYAFSENPGKFAYPDFGAGVAFSQQLIRRIGRVWPVKDFRSDFTIDPKHEIAMYVNHGDNGTLLTVVPELCTYGKTDRCATWLPVQFPDCGKAIPKKDLIVAVKTCEKFHNDRVKVVKETWAKDAKYIEYFSETEDPSIPTINLGVKNTERGHCEKTIRILKRYHKEHFKDIPWLLITDDDTIINLKRLRRLLACYDPTEPIHLGEKYGYMVTKGDNGYSYITGGGGMIFSGMAVDAMIRRDRATCPSDDSPDDMILGRAFKLMDIPLVHSAYFHQARPEDYSPEFLKARTALSFHKHFMTDPYRVYKDLMVKTETEAAEAEKIKAKKAEKLKKKKTEPESKEGESSQTVDRKDTDKHEEL